MGSIDDIDLLGKKKNQALSAPNQTKKHITSTFNDRSTGSCICLRLDLYMPHVSLLCFYAYRLYLTCGMDKCSLRHIHDPVLLPLKVEVLVWPRLPTHRRFIFWLRHHMNNHSSVTK